MSVENAVVVGVVEVVGEVQTFSKFQKSTIVIVTTPDHGQGWPQYVSVDLTGDRAGEIDRDALGCRIKMECKIGGRKWQKDADSEVKYFNSCEAVHWQIKPNEPATAPVETAQASDTFDDVPF